MFSSGIEVIGHGVVRGALECDLAASFRTSSDSVLLQVLVILATDKTL